MQKAQQTQVFFLILFSFFSFHLFAQNKHHVPGELLVKLAENVNAQQWAQDKQYLHGRASKLALNKKVSHPLNIYSFTFDHNSVDENKMLDFVLQDRHVVIAQFNHYVKFRSTVPNDPQFNDQWQYLNTGQSGGTVGADIDADLAWDVTTGGLTPQGDTIVVCIIDGGFQISHPDLAPNVWRNHAEIPNNGVDDDNNGFVDDVRGWNTGLNSDDVTQGDDPSHGTAVAGIVGAKGNDGIGVAGVNWDVKLMLVSGGTGVESEVLTAYSYPLTARKKYNETNGQEGAFVVATNASWGVDGGQASSAPLWCAFYDSLGVHGILNAGATINGNQNIDEFGDLPTTCPSDYLIGVTNMDHNDTKVTQAGYGSTHVDMGAFGAGTWTTAIGSTYDAFGGTSGATPHVAGAIALLYAAPCSNFTALVKSNPSAAALQVREYILNGGDDNNSLQGITTTGKRLNVNNSIQLLMTSCGPCPSPSALATNNLTDTQADLTWTSSSAAASDTLRWRAIGGTWTIVAGASSPVSLTNLSACTDYEFQVKSQCDTIGSDYSAIHAFKTDGCCENPADLSFSNISNSTASASWQSVLAAQSYNIRIRQTGTSEWTTNNTTNTSFDFSALAECTTYEVQIQTVCTDQSIDFSSSTTFKTTGCGACTDLSYCTPPTLNASDEWIETLVFNTINNTSGANNGYGDFTSENGTELMTNNSYQISITPGYSGEPYNENIKAWIDYNADGDFEDEGEEIFSATDITAATSAAISIPSNAVVGSTRMRLSMMFDNTPEACSSNAEYGEIEDYCVNIVQGTAQCIAPTGLDSTMIAENAIDLSWQSLASATSYIVRYKKATDNNWTEQNADNAMVSITGLENCSDYEAQVKSVCANGESDFSSSFNFRTDCTVATHDLSKELSSLLIAPNPFNDKINIDFAFDTDKAALNIQLLNALGQVQQSQSLSHVPAYKQSISFDGSKLSAGLYFIRFQTNDGHSFSKKVIKTNR